jgi:hypothetical protein
MGEGAIFLADITVFSDFRRQLVGDTWRKCGLVAMRYLRMVLIVDGVCLPM